MITVDAPGKAVIWGEYAVLAGAPALVMALDRYATCTIEPGGERWRCRSSGYDAEDMVSAADLSTGRPAAGSAARPLAAAALALGLDTLPPGADVHLDTRAFHDADGRKLGIGSSAAICTATCAALAELTGTTATFEQALAAHRWLQGSAGSGVDVAAAWLGGVLRFEDGQPRRARWPDGLGYRFVFTGASAATPSHLGRFGTWREAADTRPLDALTAASAALFEDCSEAALGHYVGCLKALDEAASLGIYSDDHKTLDALAIGHQVVYKPCGAGGGDIGVALCMDQEHLNRFANAVIQRGYQILSTEIADHGIEPRP